MQISLLFTTKQMLQKQQVHLLWPCSLYTYCCILYEQTVSFPVYVCSLIDIIRRHQCFASFLFVSFIHFPSIPHSFPVYSPSFIMFIDPFFRAYLLLLFSLSLSFFLCLCFLSFFFSLFLSYFFLSFWFFFLFLHFPRSLFHILLVFLCFIFTPFIFFSFFLRSFLPLFLSFCLSVFLSFCLSFFLPVNSND